LTTLTQDYNAAAVQAACDQALVAARAAAKKHHDEHGDRDACGFAWVDIYGVRSNSRLGKTLQTYGFRKSYTGSLQLWNPSGAGVQSISTLEAGAEAYAEVLTRQLGIRAYAGSRLD
jgi:hypothetical protein